MMSDTSVATMPTMIEIRAPQNTRDSTSRPNSSRPAIEPSVHPPKMSIAHADHPAADGADIGKTGFAVRPIENAVHFVLHAVNFVFGFLYALLPSPSDRHAWLRRIAAFAAARSLYTAASLAGVSSIAFQSSANVLTNSGVSFGGSYCRSV